MDSILQTRRRFFTSMAFGTIALSAQAMPLVDSLGQTGKAIKDPLFYRYPAIDDSLVSEMVGAAHGRFDKVKELVKKRRELAKAVWDWGFGDYESALGAASHMGRKDIAEFLIENGAKPNIFTFAMLGELDTVKSMIKAIPGIQKTHGPHGLTLLEHAKIRQRVATKTGEDQTKANDMVAYLESLGDAHLPSKSLPVSEKEQEIYLGEYRWGPGDDELFFVELNRRNLLYAGRKGTFGRTLNKIEEHLFTPDGAPSVRISFTVENGKAVSMTIHEPNPIVTAKRV